MKPFIFISLLCVMLSACGGKSDSGTSANSGTNTKSSNPFDQLAADKQNGIFLFNFHCSGCHGQSASGSYGPNIQGRPPEDIRWALNNVAPMDFLPEFSDQELVDIAGHLACLQEKPLEDC